MKRPNPNYTFIPTQSKLDLSAILNFDVRNLLAVIHLPSGAVIYAPTPTLGYASIAGGNVLTLKASVAGMQANDPLLVLYDDGLSHVVLDNPNTYGLTSYTVPIYVTPVSAAVPLTPGTPVNAGRKLVIVCTTAGNVCVKLGNSSTMVIAVSPGTSELDGYGVIDIVAGSTTATCTYYVCN